jgi:CDP-diacylglycerol---serine O-phosphatidyltransferase
MPVLFGAFRLARFNVMLTDLSTKGDFTGLPIPLQAITNAVFVISYYHYGSVSDPYSYFFFPLVILLALLMVSNIKYNSLPKLNEKSVLERVLVIAVFFIVVGVSYITDGIVLFYVLIAIVFSGILRQIYVKLFATN